MFSINFLREWNQEPPRPLAPQSLLVSALSRSVKVGIKENAGDLTLEVTDQGHGMAPASLGKLQAGLTVSGIGIWTMAERMKQAGGRLEIDAGHWGMTVKAIVPLAMDR